MLGAWIAALMPHANLPSEQYRHEQLSAMQAAFSRFGAANGGTLDRQELPDFLRFVVASMNSPAVPAEQVIARSTELTQQLMAHIPSHETKPRLTLEDILTATEKTLTYPSPASAEDPQDHERGRLGSKQLRTLRTRLERNRLTMPLFDTKGWVRDFEKALKIQCASLQLSTVSSFPHRACAYLPFFFLLRPLRTGEIYANGLSPMHIVVARSDRLYGTEEIHRHPSNGAS